MHKNAHCKGHSQGDSLAKQRAWHSTLEPSEASTYGMECNRFKPSSKQEFRPLEKVNNRCSPIQQSSHFLVSLQSSVCLIVAMWIWVLPRGLAHGERMIQILDQTFCFTSRRIFTRNSNWIPDDSFVTVKGPAQSLLLSRLKFLKKQGASLTWLTPLPMLFSPSSRVLGGMSWVDVYIPQIQPMSSFFGIFRNRMMSPVVLIYSRCGRCCSPQRLVVAGGGGEGLEDTQSHHWLTIYFN